MARPIWSGSISFGLLQIPVQLMAAERRVDLHFRMLDSRDNSPIRYERVNAETGEEVPWKDVVKAFEYQKGNYVVLEKEDFKRAAPESAESVEIVSFIDAKDLSPKYFEKPYYLVPNKKFEKGYVLLREILQETGRAGLARVVIRTREYLSLVVPEDKALVLLVLRYPQELVDAGEYAFPEKALKDYRITKAELDMGRQLVDSMTAEWKPSEHKDEFRERLHKAIDERVRQHKGVHVDEPNSEAAATPGKVVDFMALLKKSLSENKRTPPATSRPAPARKSAARKAPARRRKA